MTRMEIAELDALRYAGVPEMPAEADEHTPVWIYAIARVTTNILTESYAIVKMDYGRSPIVIRSFTDEGIVRIDSVHPFKFLDARFVPSLESAVATKQYVAQAYGVSVDEVKKLKKPDILRLFYMHCIKTQLKCEEEQSNKLPI